MFIVSDKFEETNNKDMENEMAMQNEELTAESQHLWDAEGEIFQGAVLGLLEFARSN